MSDLPPPTPAHMLVRFRPDSEKKTNFNSPKMVATCPCPKGKAASQILLLTAEQELMS